MKKWLLLPQTQVLLHLALLIAAVSLNKAVQAFCVPVFWARLTLYVVAAGMLFFPLRLATRLEQLLAFVNGFGLCVCLYSILFLEEFALYAVLLIPIGYGIVLLGPVYFLIRFIRHYVTRPASGRLRGYFLGGATVGLILFFLAGFLYHQSIQQIHQAQRDGMSTLPKTYMNERVLGMHFLYHTRICIYDGWRPPYHDPLLVAGLWWHNYYDPANPNLGVRISQYRECFPNLPVRADCACANNEAAAYFNEPLLK